MKFLFVLFAFFISPFISLAQGCSCTPVTLTDLQELTVKSPAEKNAYLLSECFKADVPDSSGAIMFSKCPITLEKEKYHTIAMSFFILNDSGFVFTAYDNKFYSSLKNEIKTRGTSYGGIDGIEYYKIGNVAYALNIIEASTGSIKYKKYQVTVLY
jgi:hypothetical protein